MLQDAVRNCNVHSRSYGFEHCALLQSSRGIPAHVSALTLVNFASHSRAVDVNVHLLLGPTLLFGLQILMLGVGNAPASLGELCSSPGLQPRIYHCQPCALSCLQVLNKVANGHNLQPVECKCLWLVT